MGAGCSSADHAVDIIPAAAVPISSIRNNESINIDNKSSPAAAKTENNKEDNPISGCPLAIIGYSYLIPGGYSDNGSDSDLKLIEFFDQRQYLKLELAKSGRFGKGTIPFDRSNDPDVNPFQHGSLYENLFTPEEVHNFDPAFFQMSTREAIRLDPQHRLLMQCAYRAVESAGLDIMKDLKSSNCGVFVGHQLPGYASLKPSEGTGEYSAIGMSFAMLANRVSYFFNLLGPSITYGTACSSSITALDGAKSWFISDPKNNKMALLGSSVMHIGAGSSPSFAQLGVINKDGKCKSFDERADGYVRTEGIFMYVLKRLDDAIQDQDRIHAVILDTAVNSAGPSPDSIGLASGRNITSPTIIGQELLLNKIYQQNRSIIKLNNLKYVECHATGTAMGDYNEANAIGKFYGKYYNSIEIKHNKLFLSSGRSNFGHMEASSGCLSLLKVI